MIKKIKTGETYCDISPWDIHEKAYKPLEIAARYLRRKGYDITITPTIYGGSIQCGYTRFTRYVTVKLNNKHRVPILKQRNMINHKIRQEAERRYPLWGAPLQFAAFCSGGRFAKSVIENKIKDICNKEDLTDGEVLDEIIKFITLDDERR